MMGAALARNPFLEEPAPGNSAIGQFSGAPSAPQQLEQPLPAGSSLPSNINMMASLPQINNTNASQNEGKAIYAGSSGAVSGGGPQGGAIRITSTQMKTTQAKRR